MATFLQFGRRSISTEHIHSFSQGIIAATRKNVGSYPVNLFFTSGSSLQVATMAYCETEAQATALHRAVLDHLTHDPGIVVVEDLLADIRAESEKAQEAA